MSEITPELSAKRSLSDPVHTKSMGDEPVVSDRIGLANIPKTIAIPNMIPRERFLVSIRYLKLAVLSNGVTELVDRSEIGYIPSSKQTT